MNKSILTICGVSFWVGFCLFFLTVNEAPAPEYIWNRMPELKKSQSVRVIAGVEFTKWNKKRDYGDEYKSWNNFVITDVEFNRDQIEILVEEYEHSRYGY